MLSQATQYLLSLVILFATIVAFFAIARGRFREFRGTQSLLRIIAALPLLISAVAIHFVGRNQATAMIPPVVPSPIAIVVGTGVLEILGAIGLFVRPLRRTAALCISFLMVLVFPANIFVAGETFFGATMPSVPIRLIIQVIYIWIVLLAGYGLPSISSSTYSTR